jgi:hypothetical protein
VYADSESDYHQYDDFNEFQSNFKMENNIVYEVPMEIPGNIDYYTSNYYFHYS